MPLATLTATSPMQATPTQATPTLLQHIAALITRKCLPDMRTSHLGWEIPAEDLDCRHLRRVEIALGEVFVLGGAAEGTRQFVDL